MQLSPHFLLSELTVTSTGLPNDPPPEAQACLASLCAEVLEPWRATTGPLKVTSGYRTPEVNAAVGGSSTSDHPTGRAADIIPTSVTQTYAWSELVDLIRRGLPVDQAILYPGAQIHVSWRPQPRRELLVKTASGYAPWREP